MLRQPALQVLAIVARVLIALAFVPSGLVKILDEPFTSLPQSDPVGFFFAGFFSAHGYYRFVGGAQWLAAALLLVPRTATLGAAVTLPIVLNIFVITVAVGFRGTPVVTGAMLLGTLFLLAWDWDRWRPLLPVQGAPAGRHGTAGQSVALAGASGLGLAAVLGVHQTLVTAAAPGPRLAALAAAALLGLAVVWRIYGSARRHRAISAEPGAQIVE